MRLPHLTASRVASASRSRLRSTVSIPAGPSSPHPADSVAVASAAPKMLPKLCRELSSSFWLGDGAHVPVSRAHPAGQILASLDHQALLREVRGFAQWKEGGYTRVPLFSNSTYRLLLLCWWPRAASPIHSHSNASTRHPANCWLRVLEGELVETQFAFPCRPNQPAQRVGCETRLAAGTSSYMNDAMGVHKVANHSWTTGALSVHLYAPGFDGAAVFPDEHYPGGLYP